jgi:hypothetical protein
MQRGTAKESTEELQQKTKKIFLTSSRSPSKRISHPPIGYINRNG